MYGKILTYIQITEANSYSTPTSQIKGRRKADGDFGKEDEVSEKGEGLQEIRLDSLPS